MLDCEMLAKGTHIPRLVQGPIPSQGSGVRSRMAGMRRPLPLRAFSALFTCFSSLVAPCQVGQHGRGYKEPPPTAPVVITVEKATNGKPMVSTSVIFRAVRNDSSDGNLEMKTDGEGRASIELLEVGSHVTVQVIAPGYATYATDFDLTREGKQLLVKLERPRSQVSTYGEADDRPAQVQPGVQEHVIRKPGASPTPAAAPPAQQSPTSPLQTTPPVNTPGSMPAPASATPGSPQ